jgi:Zn-dependent metalloprotease
MSPLQRQCVLIGLLLALPAGERSLADPVGSASAGGIPPQISEKALSHIRKSLPELGVYDRVADFVTIKAHATRGNHYVRLAQTHAGVLVFAAQAVVRVAEDGTTSLAAVDLASAPDLEGVTTVPSITSQAARAHAVAWIQSRFPEAQPDGASTPNLQVFAPEVLAATGAPRLVYVTEVRDSAHPDASHRILVDAGDGAIVRAFPLTYRALDRRIYDSNSTSSSNVYIVRTEGQPPCAIPDANFDYDNLGDAYVWYALRHGRDAIDGQGGTIYSNVRYCEPFSPCPWSNAMWSNGSTYFGEGWAVDDVVGHEYTHGVTENESGLIYENTSGAINESLSDIFGEIVDLTNGHGLDGPDGRWLIGEELPLFTLRNMADPPQYSQPDRLHSPLYFPPVANPDDSNDQGGVHTNSGVGNKLAYLLADGGSFNGHTVTGLGLGPVADLFYEANAAILTPASDWSDLFHALRLAAIDLGWSAANRANLDQACFAVEIGVFHVNNSVSACANPTGQRVCSGIGGPFYTVGAAMLSMPAGATASIVGGTYPEIATWSKAARLEVSTGGPVRIGP